MSVKLTFHNESERNKEKHNTVNSESRGREKKS